MNRLIPCAVNKDDGKGNFVKVEHATLCDIGQEVAHTVTCHEPGFAVHHSNVCIEITGNKRRNNMETVLIKQATKEGTIELEVGGVFDASFPSSATRRGRVQDGGTVSPTLTAQNNELYRYESEYRIRKLTPRECFRLMGVTDEDSQKMMDVNSNTQCYKQAGNSIVVDVMAAMFKRLF